MVNELYEVFQKNTLIIIEQMIPNSSQYCQIIDFKNCQSNNLLDLSFYPKFILLSNLFIANIDKSILRISSHRKKFKHINTA